MSARWTPERVFVYRHPVDMRKQIDGLSALVATELGHDPADRSAYVFVSRCKRRVKVLIWHLNGYWLLYKRLSDAPGSGELPGDRGDGVGADPDGAVDGDLAEADRHRGGAGRGRRRRGRRRGAADRDGAEPALGGVAGTASAAGELRAVAVAVAKGAEGDVVVLAEPLLGHRRVGGDEAVEDLVPPGDGTRGSWPWMVSAEASALMDGIDTVAGSPIDLNPGRHA